MGIVAEVAPQEVLAEAASQPVVAGLSNTRC
ncbi:hypothetical protein BH24ACT14_BH24ACT14_05530 [soil metagenome]